MFFFEDIIVFACVLGNSRKLKKRVYHTRKNIKGGHYGRKKDVFTRGQISGY